MVYINCFKTTAQQIEEIEEEKVGISVYIKVYSVVLYSKCFLQKKLRVLEVDALHKLLNILTFLNIFLVNSS